MSWYDYVGWAGTIGVLLAYASRRPRLFDWANVVLCVPVALPALILGAYNGAAISLSFGAIGAWSLWKGKK